MVNPLESAAPACGADPAVLAGHRVIRLSFLPVRAGAERASRRPALLVTLSLGKIWYRCVDTVRGERWSSLPISLFVSPRAARLAILACCGVSSSAVVPAG